MNDEIQEAIDSLRYDVCHVPMRSAVARAQRHLDAIEKEVERLRAEANRYLQEREDALTELKPLQGQLLIQAAVRRLG